MMEMEKPDRQHLKQMLNINMNMNGPYISISHAF